MVFISPTLNFRSAVATANDIVNDAESKVVITPPVNNMVSARTSVSLNVTPVSNMATTMVSAAVTTPLVNNVAPSAPFPHVMAATNQTTSNLHTNMSVSQCWYVITIGCKTGVF